MTVQYEINPIVKPRLDEIVEAMNERYPLLARADELNPPEAVKHIYLNGKELNPDVYNFDDYKEYKVPTYEEVVCYTVKNGWHMQFNADDFYNRCVNKGWKDKDGNPFKKWTSVLDATVSRGWCRGKTPVEVRMEMPLPISIIKKG